MVLHTIGRDFEILPSYQNMKTYGTIRQELDDLIDAKVSPDVFFKKLAELHAKEISDEIDRIVMEAICPVISPVEDHIDIVRVAGSTPAPGTKFGIQTLN